MTKRRVVRLGERDGVLIKWVNEVNKENSRKVNFLAKQALTAYIKENKFVDIGHIHYDPENEDKFLEPTNISLWLGDAPLIQEWIKYLMDNNIKYSILIREILRKSITVIPKNEEARIPDYFDFDDYRVDLDHTIRPLKTIYQVNSGTLQKDNENNNKTSNLRNSYNNELAVKSDDKTAENEAKKQEKTSENTIRNNSQRKAVHLLGVIKSNT